MDVYEMCRIKCVVLVYKMCIIAHAVQNALMIMAQSSRHSWKRERN